MTRNVKKLTSGEFTKLVEELMNKTISIILQSRISCNNLQKQNCENTNFFIINNFSSYIGKNSNDEYKDLKAISDKQILYLVIDIYYNCDKVKLLCEKFSLKINLKKPREEEYIRKRLIKKLSSFIRSLYSITRLLPSFYLFQNIKFNFSLDYKIYYDNQKGEKFVKKPLKTKIILDSDIGLIEFKAKYYLKSEIFYLEKEIESKKIEEKTSNLIRRSRVLSDNSTLRYQELLEEKKEEKKISNKNKSNQYIDTYFENNNQSNIITVNNINTKIDISPKRINKQGDFISINSCSYSDDYKLEKNKSPNSIDFINKEMKLFPTYLNPCELNLEKTSSSETSSLDSYELEFESNNEENILNENEVKHREEVFVFDEMVSKIKNFKKMIRNNSYHPLLINYKSFMNVN